MADGYEISDDLLAQLNNVSSQIKKSNDSSIEQEFYERQTQMGQRRKPNSDVGEPEMFEAFMIDEPVSQDIGQSIRQQVDDGLGSTRGNINGASLDFETSRRRQEEKPQSQFEISRRRPEPGNDLNIRGRDLKHAEELSSRNLEVPNDFFDEYDEDNSPQSGPISMDRPVTPRRRPAMEDDDDEFIPKKKDKTVISIFEKFKLKPKYIAIIVGVVAFFIIGALLDKNKSDDSLMGANIDALDGNYTEDTSNNEETSKKKDDSESDKSSGNYVTNSGAQTVERGEILNDVNMSFSKEVYDDEIAVSKFLEFRGASCIPKIMGYSEVLEREIEFVISPSEYNRYLNGTKIQITYRSMEKDGITYVTDIQIKQ